MPGAKVAMTNTETGVVTHAVTNDESGGGFRWVDATDGLNTFSHGCTCFQHFSGMCCKSGAGFW
jgi:hypothetical protein